MRTAILGTCVLALLASAPPTSAQTMCPNPKDDNEVFSQYLADYRNCLDGSLASDTAKMQAATPSSPASGGFASSLRDSIEDFLPFFTFAVEGLGTSNDDNALTLRFNPIRSATLGSLGLSITATQPTAADLLLKAVPEDKRASVREALEAHLDESDDLTYSARLSFERKASAHSTWLLGRSYDNYRTLIEEDLLPSLATGYLPPKDLGDTIDRCQDVADEGLHRIGADDVAQNPITATAGQLKNALGDNWEQCLAAWQEKEAHIFTAGKSLGVLGWIPSLVDNQPQLFLTLDYTDRAAEVGRSGWKASLNYEKGFNNLNTFLRRAKGRVGDERNTAFYNIVRGLSTAAVQAENKLTFSLAYSELEPYTVDRTIGEGDNAAVLAVEMARSTELCAKLEYHRSATWHTTVVSEMEVHPKFHLSVEYIDVSDDPARRDRMVGTVTYEIPLPSGTSLPISLTYANHSQFLGEQDKELSAHFGLSYKVPGKGAKQ